MLEIGQQPDEFTLLDQHGSPLAWSSLRGHPVVVFCYPKASTPGCTQEACDFRDLAKEFAALGVTVLGLSADAPRAQLKFADKQGLGFPLLSDPDPSARQLAVRALLSAWGVWGPKKLYGREYDGIVRTTFLFDPQGRVVERWSAVKIAGHVDAVLAAARGSVSA